MKVKRMELPVLPAWILKIFYRACSAFMSRQGLHIGVMPHHAHEATATFRSGLGSVPWLMAHWT